MCVSWVAYAPVTIAVNVTWIEREFNACQMPCSMCPSIFNRFPVIQAVKSKGRYFSTCLHILVSLGTPLGLSRVTPSEFREDLDIHKTRMNGLSCGEESMTICSAFLIQYQRVTDRRTDGRTSSLYLLHASA